MVDYYPLDKIFTEGTDYETPADRFYVISALGTDAATATKLVIDGVETGEVISTIAPLHRTSANLLGPLDLGDLYYVVPPNKTFRVDGPAGAKVRAIGRLGVLAPGEVLPAAEAGRFAEQGKKFITYQTGTHTASGTGTWTADVAYEIYSLTPKTIETFRFANVLGVTVGGAAVAEGDVGIQFKLDGRPLDILTAGPGPKGIDALSMPMPPADTTEEVAFSLASRPIEVQGAINVSGGDISYTDLDIDFTAIVEYAMKA